MNIVITGASSGIGQTLAQHLADLGHQVIGTSRFLKGVVGNYTMTILDVNEDDSVDTFVKDILNKWGHIDVLINNAGYALSGSVENIRMEEAKHQFETNYFGVVRITQRFLPEFRKNKQGKIINICSMAGQIGLPFQAHYSASKFALEGFTEALRLELSAFNIQVCNINPGDFKTRITENRKIIQAIDPVYKANFERMLSTYANEENKGANPILIAKLVESLLTKRKLKVRYTVGNVSQTSAIAFKRVFGSEVFERVMKMMWRID